MNKNKFDIALCQLLSGEDKDKNIKNAERLVRKAVKDGAHVVALPEIWNSPYDNACFRDYSEPEGGKTYSFLSGLAKDLGIYLIGGSIPESEDDKVYNTSYSFDREGRLIGKHRKMHMFDIDIEGGIRFMESEALTPGDSMTVLVISACSTSWISGSASATGQGPRNGSTRPPWPTGKAYGSRSSIRLSMPTTTCVT